MNIELQTNMTVLEDIATMCRSVLKDYLPMYKATVTVYRNPERLEVVYPGLKADTATQQTLYAFGEAVRAAVNEALPTWEFQVMVVGGSDASGLEITVKGQKYPYFHIIHAADVRLHRKDLS